MLDYRKTMGACLVVFGGFLAMHMIYGAFYYEREPLFHIIIYSVLFLLPPLLAFFISKNLLIKYHFYFIYEVGECQPQIFEE